ncbi:cytochrome P450 [Dichomitus squalens]|uniref:Cytochrome P450 n=1 Tax=Dichomitus squalens TaxID=114155 RepID=A0A4Q9MN76_9APHY|nr:cytochrome P450 [Dichomitus squalens]
MFSLMRGATPVIVINKAQIAWDLLQKRSEIYSSRPRLIIAHELLSRGLRGLTMPYTKQWRTWRKIQNTGLNVRAALAYREHQTLEATNIHSRFATSVAFSIAYGQRTATLEDEKYRKNGEAPCFDCMFTWFRHTTFADMTPGALLQYPWLMYLPRFMQWFRFKWDEGYGKAEKLYMELLKDVEDRLKTGTAKECMATRSLRDQEALGISDVQLAFAMAAPFAAGIDTANAMRGVHEELDRVVGRNRLPTFDDQASLPYLDAFVKELNRWQTITPIGVPHALTADDVYQGHFVPKGTIIVPNIYTMMKDEEMFPDAMRFSPERFLKTDDPRMLDFTLSFGFGRRICPGMHVALQSLYIFFARFMWPFTVKPAQDETGATVLPDMNNQVASGLTRKPAPFKCVIQPRFPDVAGMIHKEAAEADETLKAWD